MDGFLGYPCLKQLDYLDVINGLVFLYAFRLLQVSHAARWKTPCTILDVYFKQKLGFICWFGFKLMKPQLVTDFVFPSNLSHSSMHPRAAISAACHKNVWSARTSITSSTSLGKATSRSRWDRRCIGPSDWISKTIPPKASELIIWIWLLLQDLRYLGCTLCMILHFNVAFSFRGSVQRKQNIEEAE